MGSPACVPKPQMPTDYIYVYGRVEYTDGLDGERYTNFCHRYPWARATTKSDKFGQSEAIVSLLYARFNNSGNDAN